MKKTHFILPLLLSAISVLMTVFGFAQSHVFEWKGGSGPWNDLSHWQVDGHAADALPSSEDNVLIEAESGNLTIHISENIWANSISTSGPVSFDAAFSENGQAHISGSLLFSNETEITGKITFSLDGVAPGNFKMVPGQVQDKIKITRKGSYQNIDSGNLAKANGSCPFFTIVPNPTAPTCNGFNNGIASVLPPVDGVGPFTYQWIGGPNTPQWSNLGAGTYTVIVIDVGQGGVPCNTDVFVNEPGPLTVFSMNTSPPLCFGVCDGTASPIVIGGNGGYTLNWSSGESGLNATQLCPVFTLEITDQAGCFYDTTYVFPNPPQPIQFDAAIMPVQCFGDNNGAIDITLNGGVGAITVAWNGPNGFSSTQQDISGLEPGTYTIEGEDANGCLSDSSFTITQNLPLNATGTVQNNACFGGSTGSIDLTPTGGGVPYTFAWAGPNGFISSTEDISAVEAGLYEVTVTDASFCTFTLQLNVSEPTENTVAFTSTDVLCFDGTSGAATAMAGGGTPGYTYSWTGPNSFSQSGPGISNLIAGTYIVEILDANGCIQIDSVIIDQPALLELALTPTPITCQNGNNGAIDLQITGGTAPYTIQWTGPGTFSQNTEDISGLAPGTYAATVTDFNNCTAAASVELINPAPLSTTAIVTNSTCAGGNDGAIDLTVSGGTAPFIYSWTGPAGFSNSNEDISALFAGTYNVTVTGANGCQAMASFTVANPSVLMATFTRVNLLCFGASTGSINVTPSGGAAPYTFLWIGPNLFVSNDQNISNLVAGSYSLQITDANGCSNFFSQNLTEPTQIAITGPITHVSCFGASNGAIDAIVNGATPPYTYSWTGPDGFTATTQDLTGVAAGTYSLVVTDMRGCTRTRAFTINQPTQIVVDGLVSDAVCAGDSDGSITTTVAGGVAPYTFVWSGPNGFSSTDQNITNLGAGTYNLLVTGSNGCTVNSTFQISETVVLSLSAIVTDVLCFGENTGSIDFTVSGGAIPYDIEWTGPDSFTSTQEDISDLDPGDYTVIVMDASGCERTQTFTIVSPELLDANIIASDITCFGNGDGSLSANVQGGTLPYTFAWSGPDGFVSGMSDITNLSAGNYAFTVTDNNGCQAFGIGSILEPDSIVLDIDIVQPSCLVDDGSLTANVAGGTIAADYLYSWMNNSGVEIGTAASVFNLAPGQYSLTVTDDNGCNAVQTVELTRVTFNINAVVQNINCTDSVNGSIALNPTSGTAPFIYQWVGPAGFISSDPNIADLQPGTYEVLITDAAGCELNLSFDLDQPAPIIFQANVTPEACPGDMDGSITLSLQGGTAPYGLSWSGPDMFKSGATTIIGLSPGLYMASITDANGCQADTTIEVIIGSDFAIAFDAQNPLCPDAGTGSIDATVLPLNGFPEPFTFQWSGPDGYNASTEDIFDISDGEYVLTVTGVNGCQRTDTITLSDPEAITVDVISMNSNCLASDGSATATASGGTGLIAFSWNDNNGNVLSTSAQLDNVPAGLYTITASDENGCTAQDVVVISDSSGSVDGIVNNTSCPETADGSIDIEVIDGTAPFTFEWSDDNVLISTDEDLTNLVAGTYSVMVTDANGCIYAASFNVAAPETILAAATIEGVSCFGNDGAIDLILSGGIAPYQINWSGPNGFTGSGNAIADLEIGTYTYEIIDANTCTINDSIVLQAIPPLTTDADVLNVICAGDNTGAIDLNIADGSPPYVIQWVGPNGFTANTENLNGILAGQYIATIIDGRGCELTDTLEITENPAISILLDIVSPDCNANNGSIAATISGGVASGGYAINWTDQNGIFLSSDTFITGLAIGIYNLNITDDNGCISDSSITLSNPDADIQISTSPVVCFGDANGSIDLDINDITLPYTIEWSGPNGFTADAEDITDLIAGTFNYTITGADGCVYVGMAEVDSPEALNATGIVANTCFGETSGSIALTTSGGTIPYTFDWSGPDGFISSDQNLADLNGGIYNLMITDQNACTIDTSFEIIENPEILLAATVSPIACNGDSIGAIELDVTGGTDPYDFTWMGDNGFTSDQEDLINIGPGIYSLTITDSNECSRDTAFTLSEPAALTIAETVVPAGCNGPFNLGQASLDISGGTEPYVVSWTGPNNFTSTAPQISSLEPGIFTYILSDGNGCTASGEIEIIQVEPIAASVESQNASCAGLSDASLTANVTGGIGPYTYSWTGPNDFESDQAQIDNLLAGNYLLTISDSSGCIVDFDSEIMEPEPLEITSNEIIDATCNTSSDGAISISTVGGTSPYTYNWSGPQGFNSNDNNLTGLTTGDYEVMVVDSNNCETIGNFTLAFTLEIAASAGADMNICQSILPATIIGSGLNASIFNWTNLDGDTLSTDSLLTITGTAGTYGYILLADNGLCQSSDTLTVAILPSPIADAGAAQDVFAEQVFTLGGNPVSATATAYSWFPNATGSFNSNEANPSGFILETTEFTVEVTDANGCVGRDSVLITVLPEVIITSGFTPNDDGKNDSWIIDNIELFPNNAVNIFSRWGEAVYSVAGYNSGNAWDGTFEGAALPIGTYYYTIELNDTRFPEPFTGPITIYR